MTQTTYKRTNRRVLRTYAPFTLALMLVLLTTACGGDSQPSQQTISESQATSAPQIETDQLPLPDDIVPIFLTVIWTVISSTVVFLAGILFELICSLAVWWVSLVVGIVVFAGVMFRNAIDRSWQDIDWRYESLRASAFAVSSTLALLVVSLLCWILG